MRLGTHAVVAATIPLSASSMIGIPTVYGIICEHVSQCFGFPKVTFEAVEEIISKVVTENFGTFMWILLKKCRKSRLRIRIISHAHMKGICAA